MTQFWAKTNLAPVTLSDSEDNEHTIVKDLGAMSIPEISEAIIRHNSNALSYSRGEEYYRRGAIPS